MLGKLQIPSELGLPYPNWREGQVDAIRWIENNNWLSPEQVISKDGKNFFLKEFNFFLNDLYLGKKTAENLKIPK